MLLSSYFPRMFFSFFYILSALRLVRLPLPSLGFSTDFFLGMWQASCGWDEGGPFVPAAVRQLHRLD